MKPFLRRLGRLALKLVIPLVLIAIAILAAVSWPAGPEAVEAEDGAWTCSMHPQVRLPRPGKCPICGMTLISLEEGRETAARVPGLEVESVVRRELFREVRTVGRVDYSEARVEDITARTAGRVDLLFVDFTGVRVEKGDHLVDIYSPDLYSAQQELLTAIAATGRGGTGGERSLDRFNVEMQRSAREKLRLWGLTSEQIVEVETSGKPKTHLTIYSPLAGTVIDKRIRLGQYVKEGDLLYRVADLETVWLYLELYEYDVSWIQYGQDVDVTLEAYPGETFDGTVVFIDPFLNEESRTVRVRVNMANSLGRLKPGMYATAVIRVPLLADGSPAPTGLEGKYFCAMHPDVVSEKPGKCRVCEMELIRIPERLPPDSSASTLQSRHKDRPLNGRDDSLRPLAIRSSAVLDTGRRQVAYRQTKSGFELVELTLGPLAVIRDERTGTATFYPVVAGLEAGDRVVVQGGFLLDSQAQIDGRPSLLYSQGQSAANLHSGHAMPASPAPDSPSRPGHQH